MEEIISANLKKSISSTLQTLSEEKVHEIVKVLLEDAGLESMEDLKLIKDEDLQPLLKPLQRRKLLMAWQDKASDDLTRSGQIDDHIMENSENQRCQMSPSAQSLAVSNENWLKRFSIPWDKMPQALLKSLKSRQRLDPKCRKEMIRIIADEIRTFTFLPGIEAIRFISNIMVEKYPDSLMDRHDGKVFAGGASSVVKQLRNRLENLNRGSGSSKRNRTVEEIEDDAETKDKNKETKKYGCINWKPKIPETETQETQEAKRLQMIEHMKCGPKHLDNNFMIQLVSETFYSQRVDINKNMQLHDVLKKWPGLFLKSGILTHFQLLVGVDLEEALSNSLTAKGERLLKYFNTIPPGSNKNQLQTALNNGKNYEECALIINAVVGYFGENAGVIFKDVAVTTSSSDVQGVINVPETPCLLACGNDCYDSDHYMLMVDGIVVNENISSFREGFLMVFAIFYLFNIKYPANIDCSLEFIQRCFFSINPDRGSKSSKKCMKDLVLPRVQTLITNLSDFEWL